MKEITQVVADFYGIWSGNLYIHTRKAEILRPRQVAIYLIKILLDPSVTKIGIHFEKDHATILHTVKVMGNEILTNKKLKEDIDRIIVIINENHPEILPKKVIKNDEIQETKVKMCNQVKFFSWKIQPRLLTR